MWSFALLGALLLLFPGFCCLAGIYYSRKGSNTKLSGVPDLPAESPIAIAFVIGGALGAHLLGAWVFFLQEKWCYFAPVCVDFAFDPNPYTVLISGNLEETITGSMVAYGLSYLAALGALTTFLSTKIANTEPVQKRLRPTFAYWLYELIRKANTPDKVIIAHVVSNLGNGPVFAGYVGAVEVIKLGKLGDITSISLTAVDRFSVIIDEEGMRSQFNASEPMPFFHITHEDISNLNFEVLDLAQEPELEPDPEGEEGAQNREDAPRDINRIEEAQPTSDPFWRAFWSAFTVGLISPTAPF